MADSDKTSLFGDIPRRSFATTRWTTIERAGGDDGEKSRLALETVCRTYWYPLYAYIRRLGYQPADAEDLAQGFFADLLQRKDLARVDRAKGKFRSFLLASLKHYLSKQRGQSHALKRGGGQSVLPLSGDEAESRYQIEPANTFSPDQLFDRRWALTLLEVAMNRLREEYGALKKSVLFEQLKPSLTGDRMTLPYAELAQKLNLSESNVKVTIHRLRRRYAELLREEIARTVSDPGETESEYQYLFKILG